MRQGGVGALGRVANFRAQGVLASVFVAHRNANEFEQRAGSRKRRGGVGNIACVILDHVPNSTTHVASGQRVVAHEGHAICRQMPRDQRHQMDANLRGNPRVEAVRDDVIEAAEIGGKLTQVEFQQLDVGESEITCHAPGVRDRPRGEIEAHEGRVRQRSRNRHQVRPVAARELQHTAGCGRRDVETEQRADRGETIRMAHRVRKTGVRDVVVALEQGIGPRLERIGRRVGQEALAGGAAGTSWLRHAVVVSCAST